MRQERERIHKCDDFTHGVRRQTRNKHNKKNRRQVPKIPSPRTEWNGIGIGMFGLAVAGWDAFWNK